MSKTPTELLLERYKVHDAKQVKARRWKAVGLILCIGSMPTCMASGFTDNPGQVASIGVGAFLVGLVVFIIGRFRS